MADSDFSAIYNQGSLELFQTLVANIQGKFVVNSVSGANFQAYQSRFYYNQVGGAIIRTMHHSWTLLDECQLLWNSALATVATVYDSTVELISTHLQDNQGLMDVLALYNSQISAHQVCSWSPSLGVVVGATSGWNETNSYLQQTDHICDANHMLFLDKADSQTLDCLERNSCQGTCIPLSASSCALPELDLETLQRDLDNPTPFATSTSSAIPLRGTPTTIWMMILSGIFVMW